jgi:hypothetical protein
MNEIRDLLRRTLVEGPALTGCTIREHILGGLQIAHASPMSIGRIDFAVRRGAVTLAGEVPSLAQARLAGARAWCVPGTRDVINALAVQPAEER